MTRTPRSVSAKGRTGGRKRLSPRTKPFGGHGPAEYEADAERIAKFMYCDLPGGTFERAMVKLLSRMADEPAHVNGRPISAGARSLAAKMLARLT